MLNQKRYFDPAEALAARSRPTPAGCIEWTGYRDDLGYGRIKYEGRSSLTHRVSYLIHKGSIPDGLLVLHECDNPSCINIDHLFLGTDQTNVDDMLAKGRGCKARGEGHGRTKLTEDDVRAIRADPRGAVRIARDYGMSKSAIAHIRGGSHWSHVV